MQGHDQYFKSKLWRFSCFHGHSKFKKGKIIVGLKRESMVKVAYSTFKGLVAIVSLTDLQHAFEAFAFVDNIQVLVYTL